MQSKTSSFKARAVNGALLRKNLARFWPLWAIYAAAWLIMMPVAQFVTLFGTSAQYYSKGELAANTTGMLLGMAGDAGIIMGAIFGCLAAMALCSYLCTARSVGMMHSFPIRRESLYLTNFLSGAAVFAFVNAVVFLLTAAVQGAGGVLVWKNLFLWLGCTLGTLLFFYGFAFFCAMFTGQILAIPAFYVILNGLVAGINYLVQNFASVFFYGYSGGGTPGWVVWLTPVWKLIHGLQADSDWNDKLQYSCNYHLENPGVVAIYAAVGVVLAAAGLLVYRARRSETAGDTVTVRWAKPIFCYGVAVCFALSLGQGLYFLVWQEFRSSNTYSMPAILVCMILTGLVGYYAAEMLLKKSFRVFKKSWKGAAVLVAALVVFGVGVSLDVTGVEHKVPEASAVESLGFSIDGQNSCSGNISDPEVIEKFRTAHQAILDEKKQSLSREREYQNDTDGTCGYNSAYITLNYYLKNGGTVSRSYNLFIAPDDLNTSGSAASLLAQLATSSEVQRANLFSGKDYTGKLTAGEMYYQIGDGYQDSVTFDGDTARILYAAVLQDIDAGHFGMNQFNYDAWWQDSYNNSLLLYYSSGNDEMDSICIDFSTNCTYLVAALKETGVVNQEHALTTYAENDEESLYGEQPDEPSGNVVAADTVIEAEKAAAVIGGADGPTTITVG